VAVLVYAGYSFLKESTLTEIHHEAVSSVVVDETEVAIEELFKEHIENGDLTIRYQDMGDDEALLAAYRDVMNEPLAPRSDIHTVFVTEDSLFGAPQKGIAHTLTAVGARYLPYTNLKKVKKALSGMDSLFAKAIIERMSGNYKKYTVEEAYAFATRNASVTRKAQYEKAMIHPVTGFRVSSFEEIWEILSDVRTREAILKTDEFFPQLEKKKIKPRMIISCHPLLNVALAPFMDEVHSALKSAPIVEEFMGNKIYYHFCAGVTVSNLSRTFSDAVKQIGYHIIVGGDDALVIVVNPDLTVRYIETDATAFDALINESALKWEVGIYQTVEPNLDWATFMKLQTNPIEIKLRAKGNHDQFYMKLKKRQRSSGFPNTSLGNSLVMAGVLGFAVRSLIARDIEVTADNLVHLVKEKTGIILKKLHDTTDLYKISFLRGFFVPVGDLEGFVDYDTDYVWVPAFGRWIKYSKTATQDPGFFENGQLNNRLFLAYLAQGLAPFVQPYDMHFYYQSPMKISLFETEVQLPSHPGMIRADRVVENLNHITYLSLDAQIRRYGKTTLFNPIGLIDGHSCVITKEAKKVLLATDYA
jgi:hypothetical protein